MDVRIALDDKQFRRAARNTERGLSETHKVLNILGRIFRDDVRKRMNSRDSGNWANASKWTRAKKNTNRALTGQASNISYSLHGRSRASVFYSGSSKVTGRPISITEHHFGRTLPASGLLVTLGIRNPAPLRLPPGTSRVYFRWVKASVVPARKIWPDAPGEAQRIAEQPANQWIAGVVTRTWK